MLHPPTPYRRDRLFRLWAYLSTATHPTHRSVQEALGYSSTSVVAFDLDYLADLGYLAERRHAQTGIQVVVKAGFLSSRDIDIRR